MDTSWVCVRVWCTLRMPRRIWTRPFPFSSFRCDSQPKCLHFNYRSTTKNVLDFVTFADVIKNYQSRKIEPSNVKRSFDYDFESMSPIEIPCKRIIGCHSDRFWMIIKIEQNRKFQRISQYNMTEITDNQTLFLVPNYFSSFAHESRQFCHTDIISMNIKPSYMRLFFFGHKICFTLNTRQYSIFH